MSTVHLYQYIFTAGLFNHLPQPDGELDHTPHSHGR